MLLEELFARLDRGRRPAPADDAPVVIIRRIHELLNVDPSKEPVPSGSVGNTGN